ncbi:MAG: MarR family transcriptional regulator [Bryobacteraceae bacterium]|nr:MarR family transcriptional regulator [Bryobacteraceae bacterium]MDW8377618.1 MarR family transcriptional regulator [Bryobacterales bacterium]
MTGKLARSIRQAKPFQSLEEEAYLNLLRAADVLLRREALLLSRYQMTHAQYNVLRILRGAGAAGLPCGEIASRMITHDPDITRLLDRLERRGYVQRSRESSDRRVVIAKITPAGLDLLSQLDAPVSALHRRNLAMLSPAELRQLIELLERATEGDAESDS